MISVLIELAMKRGRAAVMLWVMSDTPSAVPRSNVRTQDGPAVFAVLAAWILSIVVLAAISRLAAVIYTAVMIGFATLNVIVFGRQRRRFVADNTQAVAALARGDLKTARAIFRRWAERTRQSRIAAMARHNLAWTLMRQSELQQAVDVVLDNERRHLRALKAIGLAPTSAVDLALDYALLGNLVEAERWLGEADSRAKEMSLPSLPAMKAFARAVLACRSDRCTEAVAMLEERWSEYEGTLTGETSRPLKVVLAFAIAGAGPRHAGVAEVALAAVRPTYPGEYDFLGKAWPEMAAFLSSHGL